LVLRPQQPQEQHLLLLLLPPLLLLLLLLRPVLLARLRPLAAAAAVAAPWARPTMASLADPVVLRQQLQAQLPCLRPLTTPDLLARRAASPAHSPTSARASAGRPCRAYPPSNSTWQGKTTIRRPTKRGDLRC
jgi:hypothetical protein